MYYLLNLLSNEGDKEKIEKEITKYNSTIKNLIIWRGNILAHHSISFALNPQEIFKKFPIKNEEIEGLMDLLKEVLGMIDSARTKKGQIYSFKLIKDESQRDTENIIKHLKIAYEVEKERHKRELIDPSLPKFGVRARK